MKKQSRNLKLVNIRALAILLVVFGHSIILYSDSWNLYTTTRSVPFLNTLKLIIDQVQMPLFMSVSGYLFYYGYKKRNLKDLLINKAQRLLIPYLLVSFFYLLPIRLLIHYPGYMKMSVTDFIIKFLTATDIGHLWFLPALFTIFAISKCFLLISDKLTKSSRITAFLLFALGCLLYLEGYRIGIYYPPLLNAYNYLIWFSLGFCVNAYSSLINKLYKPEIVKVLMMAIWISILIYSLKAETTRVLIKLALPGLFIVNAFGIIPNATNSAISRLDRNSFGLYLFHSPLIYIVFATIPEASPLLVVTINFVGFGLAAFCLTEAVRRLGLGFVIGE